MTSLCVPIAVRTIDEALAGARRARGLGADLVEFRVDGFFAPGDPSTTAGIVRLVAQSPLPAIVTCRSEAEGGAFTGSDEARAGLCRALADAPSPPVYIDLELASLERSPALDALARDLASRSAGGAPSPRVIVSLHDFAGRPEDLARRLVRLRQRDDAAVHKIVWRARSVRDNLELFEILAARDRPTIALGMGEFGLMSRVLAPKFGAFLTFAAPDRAGATAPGQPTVSELLGLYRFRSIGPTTRVFGVIGWPVGHSRSPAAHNAAFEAAGFDGVDLPIPIPPEWEHFAATVDALTEDPRLDFAGASVTIPHKAHLVRFARDREGWSIDEMSESCGAGNTVCRDTDGWRVANTDAPAVLACLHDAGLEPGGARVTILGAGGVARSAAAGLLAGGSSVTVAARTVERAETLARDLAPIAQRAGGAISAAPWRDAAAIDADAIINATPVGMAGGPDPSGEPIDLSVVTARGARPIVFDTVYTPRQTPLIVRARALGLRTIDGEGLFLRQAEAQSRLFMGREPPAGVMERALSSRPEGLREGG
ncbi:MAG: type I 3-dehydroquinate dehydratase [Planctomycetota bacterium]|nr:MAG: type I 3-dehydroquinate dehydratase [Planctomycetota bacterium]